jgi:hypothetical protein
MLFDQVISQFVAKDDPMIRTYSKDSFTNVSFSSEQMVDEVERLAIQQ